MIVLAAAGVVYGYRLFPASSDDPHPSSAGRHGYVLVATWLVLPLLGIYFLSFIQPVFAPRYLIWIAPAVMMVLALGVQLLRPDRSRGRRYLATLLVVFIVGHGLATGRAQGERVIKSDLRGAVSYLVEHREPEELLIFHIPHLEYAYRYYSGKALANPFADSDGRLGWSADGLWTNYSLDQRDAMQNVDAEMRALTAGAEDIFIMRSEVELWDTRDLMKRWLGQHGERIESVDFRGVQVIHYRMKGE